MNSVTVPPVLSRVVERHREFFAGTRDYLVKINVPLDCRDGWQQGKAFDDLDWERDFDDYVRINVENGKLGARCRLALGIDDDSIPFYHPYFGISIHHSFFGGKVTFSGGTSYAAPVIDCAADWPQLHADPHHPWLQKLARGLDYARTHGDGVLFASYRGGNGPLDMANGVLGDALYIEFYDDPENLHRLMDICTQATLMTFDLQKAHNSEIAGGRIVPMGGLWAPDPVIGHISLDAACLASPSLYDEFEKPYLERLTASTGGVIVHTHMLGRHCFPAMCRTQGVRLFAPADDPGQPLLVDVLAEVLDAIGDVPLMLSIPKERLAEILPHFQGRRAIFLLSAADAGEAHRLLAQVDHYCPLQR